MISYTKQIACLFLIIFASCQTKEDATTIDLSPIKSLILLDRSAVVPYDQNMEQILKQRDSVLISNKQVQAYSYTWGGEVGGPWTKILCFVRPLPNRFQCEFLYEGEYEMSIMRGNDTAIKSGKDHPLGLQLTKVGQLLGYDISNDKEKMKELLVEVMQNLLHCQKVRKSFMDSLDLKKIQTGQIENLNFRFSKQTKLIKTLQQVKDEMSINPDPNVVFFHGELINGIWKGTVRQYDHTGRFCIDLEYLNGEFAYTLWL